MGCDKNDSDWDMCQYSPKTNVSMTYRGITKEVADLGFDCNSNVPIYPNLNTATPTWAHNVPVLGEHYGNGAEKDGKAYSLVGYGFSFSFNDENGTNTYYVTPTITIFLATNNIYYVCVGNTNIKGGAVDRCYSYEMYLHERGHQMDNLALFSYLHIVSEQGNSWSEYLAETTFCEKLEEKVTIQEVTNLTSLKPLPGIVLPKIRFTLDKTVPRNDRSVKPVLQQKTADWLTVNWSKSNDSEITKIEKKIMELNDRYHNKYGNRGNPWTGRKR